MEKISFEMVKCLICGASAHFIEPHIVKEHGIRTEAYLKAYPGASLYSPLAVQKLKEVDSNSKNRFSLKGIKSIFGTCPFTDPDASSVMAFDKPHSTTPKVDEHYRFYDELLAVVLFAINNQDERLLLVGPTGSGKSSVAEQVAARLNWAYRRINFDSDTTRADIVGQWILVGEGSSQKMVFNYGILPLAMKEGAILLVDEWDCANPSVGMVLQAVLEGNPLTIAETGETVAPHQNFRIIATANTVGQGDESGIYNGTTPQNFATLDRFSLVEKVNYPGRVVEKKIITKKTGIKDTDTLDKLTRTAKLIRNAFIQQEIRTTMSTRTVINVAKKILAFGDVRQAYTISYLNKLNSEDRDFVAEIIQRIWGV